MVCGVKRLATVLYNKWLSAVGFTARLRNTAVLRGGCELGRGVLSTCHGWQIDLSLGLNLNSHT